MNLSIIVPMYNEEKFIKKIILKIKKVNFKKEIFIVDDGSTDHSLKFVRTIKSDKNNKIILLRNKKNYGKGYSIRKALKRVKNDIIIIQDADLEYSPFDYYKLIKPIKCNYTNVVYGSRFLNKKIFNINQSINFKFRAFMNLLLTYFSNFLNSQKLTDAHTCYKVFHRKLISRIKLSENGFSFCPEITSEFSRIKEKIVEVPISFKPRKYSQGKKIQNLDGLKAIITLLKCKFTFKKKTIYYKHRNNY